MVVHRRDQSRIMKRLKKLKRPKLTAGLHVRRPYKRTKSTEERVDDALSNVPRITNDTVGEHREEVLSTARKYIYPLKHSKHRVVRTSLGLLFLVVVSFFTVCGLSLYKFQNTSTFIYDVTRIVPFPVAKAGHNWVSYESYLFELRRNMHYYRTQQQANFETKDGRSQLTRLKKQALAQTIQDAYIRQLAAEHQVSVSDQAVTHEIEVVRIGNRLGSSEQSLSGTLNNYFGWNVSDLRRKIKQELLGQAVVNKLDTVTSARARAALQQLKGGADFATLAGQLSDDLSTKANGGQYPNPITARDLDIPPVLTAEIFKLKPGQISDIVNTGYALEIVKIIDANANTVHAAHIQFTFKDINTYVKPLQTSNPLHLYIKS